MWHTETLVTSEVTCCLMGGESSHCHWDKETNRLLMTQLKWLHGERESGAEGERERETRGEQREEREMESHWSSTMSQQEAESAGGINNKERRRRDSERLRAMEWSVRQSLSSMLELIPVNCVMKSRERVTSGSAAELKGSFLPQNADDWMMISNQVKCRSSGAELQQKNPPRLH